MSKIALTGNASGTGTLTIAAPNTSTDRTLTLPDAAGTLDRVERAGNVLQVVQYNTLSYSTAVSTTSASFVATGVKKTITPIFSNSLIIIQTHLSMVYTTGWGRTTLYLNGSQMSGAGTYTVGYTDSSTNNYSPNVCNAQYQATSTSPLEFEVYMMAGSGTISIHGSSSSSMTLWEIAQ